MVTGAYAEGLESSLDHDTMALSLAIDGSSCQSVPRRPLPEENHLPRIDLTPEGLQCLRRIVSKGCSFFLPPADRTTWPPDKRLQAEPRLVGDYFSLILPE